MADNITISTIAGNPVVAAELVGGVYYPVSKVGFGDLDTYAAVTATVGLPVNLLNASIAITAAALPLPAGAATAAKQAAPGVAGTPSADVLTVQGIAAGTALPVSGTVSISGIVPVTVQQSNITADYDSGAGTQNLTLFGMALPASGGAVAGGTAANPFRIDPTGTTTQPVSGTVTANAGTGTFATRASAATTDAITAYLAADKLQNGLVPLTPKSAFANVTTSGDTTIVPAVAGKKILILSYTIGPVTASTNVFLKSAAAGAIQSTKALSTGCPGFSRAFSPVGHGATVAGEALVINSSVATPFGVDVDYVEV